MYWGVSVKVSAGLNTARVPGIAFLIDLALGKLPQFYQTLKKRNIPGFGTSNVTTMWGSTKFPNLSNDSTILLLEHVGSNLSYDFALY